jgi:omega-6 fatty acid desaturase (delta-12 desaturase)
MLSPNALHLKKDIAPYEKPCIKASVRQILNSVLPYFILWFLAYQSLAISYWLTLILTIVASGFLVRIFILFHDCCHQSFFKNRSANEVLGTITGILTFFPFHKWKHSHSIHHATSSNLNKRGTGDVWILTVDEYLSASIWTRIAYHLYRNPIVMFGFGPFFIFLIQNRLNRKNAKKRERINTYTTNLVLVSVAVLLCWAMGWQAFLMIQAPIFLISGAIGIWLFYVQHQFEDSYFELEESWDFMKAAIEGSSYYKLPRVFQWITGNIGFHHIHHLSPRVPNYYLEKAHDNIPVLQTVNTITVASSLQSLRFRLWDTQNKKFVGFRDVRGLIRSR